MASNLTVDTLTKGATTLNTDELVDINNTRVCKAWVNFNGTGTVAIRASYNVSSITDVGTGKFLVNFTTAMADTNYTTNYTSSHYRDRIGVSTAQTVATSTDLTTYNSTGALSNTSINNVLFYR